MIIWMRRIRQRLVADSKFTKYMIYVIGEIILIVIGILIALSIDTWNSNRMESNTEIALLKEMKNNLAVDLEDTRLNIEINKMSHMSNTLVLESLAHPEKQIDSLGYFYAHLTLSTILDVNNTSYESLQSLGFHTIKNDSLRIKITELYSITYEFLAKMENVIYSIQMDKVTPLVISNIITDIPYISARPVNPEALSKNHEFIETLKLSRQWFLFMISLYEDAEHHIVALINMIDKEIENRE